MYPERRFYKSSGQPQTLPRIYPSFKEDFLLVTDLYLVYEGINETTGRPIIKAHLNPMVPWIWTGLIVMVFGTILALVPNAAPARVTAPVAGARARDGGSGRLKMTSLVLKALVCNWPSWFWRSFSSWAPATTRRFNKLGHSMMCTCGCGQVLLECNHVGASRPTRCGMS